MEEMQQAFAGMQAQLNAQATQMQAQASTMTATQTAMQNVSAQNEELNKRLVVKDAEMGILRELQVKTQQQASHGGGKDSFVQKWALRPWHRGLLIPIQRVAMMIRVMMEVVY